MLVRATTKISVLRGTTTNAFGDEVDNFTVAASGIPASLIEQTRQMFTRESTEPRVVRYTVGRVTAGTDIRQNDVLLDERTSVKYIVQAVSGLGNPVRMEDLRLDLKRTS